MASYNWELKDIKNSKLPEKLKVILENESKHKIDETTLSRRYLLNNYQVFKNLYLDDTTYLKCNYPELTSFIDRLDCDVLKNAKRINLNLKNRIEPEHLIKAMSYMLIELEDLELLKAYKNIIDPSKNYLNIKRNSILNNKRFYGGRCLVTPNSLDTYISLYTYDNLEDYVFFAHEIGHALQHRLFSKKVNGLYNDLFTEVPSYYFQLLMSSYLGTNNPLADDLLLLNSVIEIQHKVLTNKLSNFVFRENKINKNDLCKLYNENSLEKVCFSNNPLALERYTGTCRYITSYMIALKLFYETLENKEAGIEHYKDMMSDSDNNLMRFLNRHDINFIEDNKEYDYIKTKSLKTYNKLCK